MTMLLSKDIEKYLDIKKGVIHVGAHDGKERTWYNNQGFTKVMWFEPNRDLYAKLLNNISAFDHHAALNIGIHDTLTEATLHIASNGGQSSSILPLGTHAKYYPHIKYVEEQKIILRRLDYLFTPETIRTYNFLNIDVQGVELNVLKSMGEYITQMRYINVEVNEEELYVGCALATDIDEYLRGWGFIRLLSKISPKEHWGDAFYKRY